jgi:hypothetical protein
MGPVDKSNFQLNRKNMSDARLSDRPRNKEQVLMIQLGHFILLRLSFIVIRIFVIFV